MSNEGPGSQTIALIRGGFAGITAAGGVTLPTQSATALSVDWPG